MIEMARSAKIFLGNLTETRILQAYPCCMELHDPAHAEKIFMRRIPSRSDPQIGSNFADDRSLSL